MLANFFGKSNPINFVIISILFFVYFFLNYFFLNSQIPIEEIIVLVPLILVIFFFYNFILYKNKLTLYNSYGFLFFVILFGVFSATNFDRNTILLHGLLLIFYRKLFSLRNSTKALSKLFDSGFWLGILFIFEPFFSILGLLIYLSNSLFQKTNWQTILTPVVGFFVPIVCSFAYYFWLDQSIIFWNLFDWYTSYNYESYGDLSLKTPMLIFGFLTLFAFVLKTPKVIQVSGSYRKYWTMITVVFFLSVLFLFLLKSRNGTELQYLFFPTSIILANWIESIKSKFLKEVILFLAIAAPFCMLIV